MERECEVPARSDDLLRENLSTPCSPSLAWAAGDHVERRSADHEKELALQMRISVSQDKKKFVRPKASGAEDEQAATRHAAGDSSIKPAQFPRLLTAGKGRRKNVSNKIAENGKDHGEAAECSDLGHGSRAMAKDCDKQDRDLALQTEEDRVRRLVAPRRRWRP